MRIIRPEGSGIVTIGEAPEPVAGPGEVVIATAVSALCGSELHDYRTGGVAQGNGGHEAAGRVIQLGAGVTGLAVGQRVGASAIAGCGACPYCAKGQYTWCRHFHFYGNMHAERFVAAANACHVLPDDLSWDAGVLLTGDGLGVPYHTSTKIASPEITTVAVFGVGPIGLGNVLLQSFLGRRVIAIDRSVMRLELAQRLGAQAVVNVDQAPPADTVCELTDGAGADVCIEAAGRPETALACFAAVRTAGTVVFNGEQGAVSLSPSEHFIRRDVTAVGAWFYHFSEYPAMLALYRQGLRLHDLITDQLPFTEAATAYAQFAAGRTGKVLLRFTD
jgi:threonine dehydrogenase-like Zn-dependent dehydrogenase